MVTCIELNMTHFHRGNGSTIYYRIVMLTLLAIEQTELIDLPKVYHLAELAIEQ